MTTCRRLFSIALASIAIATMSTAAYAGDSTWLLCKGKATQGERASATHPRVVVNLLEHRAADGANRALGVTIIMGDRVSRGEQRGDFDVTPTPLISKSIDGSHPLIFNGTAKLDGFKVLRMEGQIDTMFGDDAKPVMAKFVAKLKCEEL
jgi:hypothetical protein